MKNLFLYLLAFCLSSMSAYAQIEIKTQPLSLAAKTATIGLEYGLKPRLGLEVEYSYVFSSKQFNIPNGLKANAYFLSLKHYLNAEATLSKLYVGGYSSFFNTTSLTNAYTSFSLGATGGYKGLVFNDHLVLESGLNLGKRFSYKNGKLMTDQDFGRGQIRFFYEWDISLRLLVGYRF